MTEAERAVLDVVADRQASTNAPSPEGDVVQQLQYVFAETAIIEAIGRLTASPAQLETLPGNAGSEYLPTLAGWLNSKHQVAVRQAIGVAMQLLVELVDQDAGVEVVRGGSLR